MCEEVAIAPNPSAFNVAILDKDGTLVKPKSGKKFVETPYDQEPIPGAIQRVMELKAMGARLFICSNQGGIAAKHKSLDMAIAEMNYCFTLFPPDSFERAYFCPDFSGDYCWVVQPRPELPGMIDQPFQLTRDYVPHKFRKPSPGMPLAAIRFARETHQDPKVGLKVVMVGDREEDLHAAGGAGVTFINAERWLEHGFNQYHLIPPESDE